MPKKHSLQELDQLDPDEPLRTSLTIIRSIASELETYAHELDKQAVKIMEHANKYGLNKRQ